MDDPASDSAALYLDLVKRVLMRQGFEYPADLRATNWKRHVLNPLQRLLAKKQYRLVSSHSTLPGETMIGARRLDNIQACAESVIQDDVPGDLVETGVWRGGATILMRAVLAAYGVTDRKVWVADSFLGFPPTELRAKKVDHGVDFTGGFGDSLFQVGEDEVRRNFERYGLFDEQVRFLPGWFSETLPSAPIERLAVLRLDGDLYESTWVALTSLYPKLSAGGYVIVDDYGTFDACRSAVHDFRLQMHIDDPIEMIDESGVFWRRRQ